MDTFIDVVLFFVTLYFLPLFVFAIVRFDIKFKITEKIVNFMVDDEETK